MQFASYSYVLLPIPAGCDEFACAAASAWGKDLNLPVPLPLGREGHRTLAGLVLSGAGCDEFARAASSAWGKDLNLPVPLPLGREGHRTLAGLVLSGLAGSGI